MTDHILAPNGPMDASPLQPSSRRICHVCQKQFSEYTCPRCNSRYCSLQCYKAHSLRCTESFMRENVVGELQNVQPNDDSKRRMLEILKRFHSDDEEENMDEDDSLSEETIQKIVSGSEIDLQDLSIEEKKRFERALASGELSKMIEPWEPWWTNPSARTIHLNPDGTQQQLIHSLDDDDEVGSSSITEIPHGHETPLLPISKLSSAEPSLLLAFHLVDILYSYCFTLRLYNGDWQSDPIGSTMAVLSVSSVLGQGVQPQSLLEGMSYGIEQTCSPCYRHVGGLQFAMALIDNVISIISLGGTGLIISLCDLQRLLKAGEKELKLERKMMKSKRVEIKRNLKLADRKVYFIMCWVHEQPAEAWSSLAPLLSAEKGKIMVHAHGQDKTQPKPSERTGGKNLIEEVQ